MSDPHNAASAGGRPTKYNKEIQEKADLYLTVYSEQGDVVPTLVGLALFLDLSANTLYNWFEAKVSDEFLRVFTRVSDEQHRKLVNGGLAGDFNPAITKMLLTKHGYSEKQEIDHRSGDGSMTPKRIELIALSNDDSKD